MQRGVQDLAVLLVRFKFLRGRLALLVDVVTLLVAQFPLIAHFHPRLKVSDLLTVVALANENGHQKLQKYNSAGEEEDHFDDVNSVVRVQDIEDGVAEGEKGSDYVEPIPEVVARVGVPPLLTELGVAHIEVDALPAHIVLTQHILPGVVWLHLGRLVSQFELDLL